MDLARAERTVSVVVQGSEYTAYVDGVKVLTGTDKTFKSGGVGLRTWDGTEATFTEFTVRPNGWSLGPRRQDATDSTQSGGKTRSTNLFLNVPAGSALRRCASNSSYRG